MKIRVGKCCQSTKALSPCGGGTKMGVGDVTLQISDFPLEFCLPPALTFFFKGYLFLQREVHKRCCFSSKAG